MFIYENGIIVGYDHMVNNYGCQIHGCRTPELHAEVEQAMMEWWRSLPGQSRVRLGKVGMIQGSEVNLKRMENE